MRTKLGVVAVVFLLLCSGSLLAQTDDDDGGDDAPNSAPATKEAPGVTPSLKEARKVARHRCADEIRARTPRLTGDDRRNAVLVCSTKATYDCAVRAQAQKVQKAKRFEFFDGCLRNSGKS